MVVVCYASGLKIHELTYIYTWSIKYCILYFVRTMIERKQLNTRKAASFYV
jgi:hypothetical protein